MSLAVVAKVCTQCDEGKLLEEFALKPDGKGGRDSWCRACRAKARRERGYHTKRGDVSVRVLRSLRDEVKKEAKARGVKQGWLLSFLIAAALRALRNGALELPEGAGNER